MSAEGEKASKKQKKDDKKQKKGGEPAEIDYRTLPVESTKVFLGADEEENLKVALVAAFFNQEVHFLRTANAPLFPSKPALMKNASQIFGANNVARFLHNDSSLSVQVEDLVNFEEFSLNAAIREGSLDKITKALQLLDASSTLAETPFLHVLYFASLQKIDKLHNNLVSMSFANLKRSLATVTPALLTKATQSLSSNSNNSNSSAAVSDKPVPPVQMSTLDVSSIDFSATGLHSALKILFDAAIIAAFPELAQHASLNLHKAVISRCSNAKNGDFQCNNAMALAKAIKTEKDIFANYAGLTQPKQVADRLIAALPQPNPVTASVSAAPNGFINIHLSPDLLVNTIAKVVTQGCLPPPVQKKRVLVDFSSPNIAKEMHVGHLRSTIIGDAVCRMLEFVGHDVLRVNHVGDWGTQFGMLITYLLAEYPDFLSNPPDISNLTKIYKESKKRFDEDPQFKETSRLNVVKLQAGDTTCRTIWQSLCDISRKEFQKVYDMLDIKLTEVGESFYNPFIPSVIEELQAKGLVEKDAGMDIVKLPHFTIPLILRKSDGGFGYDSTDMAALKYRLFTLEREWIVVITDAGQANHFHMCFDTAKAAGWVSETHHRLDHIGFGVVCGEDGKRFKTRSSETVRLIDLLQAAKEKMHESLMQRQQQNLEFATQAAAAAAASVSCDTNNNNNATVLAAKKAKNIVPAEEIETAAARIGYGAVKYFDLKQHPETNYIFSYENMLNTKGDTAVYLMFAYARVASILRKAAEEKNLSLAGFSGQASDLLSRHLQTPEERALAFELLQFGDVITTVLHELLPNRLCDYLKEVSVKFTEFVTKCQVLNNETQGVTQARLLLCEATRRTMQQCFALLGIEPCERI